MSVMKRVSLLFRAKADKALDRMEDPRETLDYSYKQQVEMLTRVRRGVADVATSRKRVELQMNSLQKEINKRDVQARDALGKGREDLARAALQNKSQLQGQRIGVLVSGGNVLATALRSSCMRSFVPAMVADTDCWSGCAASR